MAKAGRCFLYVVGILVLAMGTLEVGTRLLGGPRGERSMYRENSRGFEQLQQLRRDLRTCGEAGRKYYEYFLFSAPPCQSATVNVNDFFSSRNTPLANEQMQGSAEFVDASAVLNGQPQDVFHDLGHVSAFGVPVVGDFIANAILARLRDGATAANAAGGAAGQTIERP
jgi:hypothetical protein